MAFEQIRPILNHRYYYFFLKSDFNIVNIQKIKFQFTWLLFIVNSYLLFLFIMVLNHHHYYFPIV